MNIWRKSDLKSPIGFFEVRSLGRLSDNWTVVERYCIFRVPGFGLYADKLRTTDDEIFHDPDQTCVCIPVSNRKGYHVEQVTTRGRGVFRAALLVRWRFHPYIKHRRSTLTRVDNIVGGPRWVLRIAVGPKDGLWGFVTYGGKRYDHRDMPAAWHEQEASQ